jgi:hypothetical protein
VVGTFPILEKHLIGKRSYDKKSGSFSSLVIQALQRRSLKVKSSWVAEKANRHFLDRWTNPERPYTIRFISLNLLLLPSTNPELILWDIAFFIGAISLFML